MHTNFCGSTCSVSGVLGVKKVKNGIFWYNYSIKKNFPNECFVLFCFVLFFRDGGGSILTQNHGLVPWPFFKSLFYLGEACRGMKTPIYQDILLSVISGCRMV